MYKQVSTLFVITASIILLSCNGKKKEPGLKELHVEVTGLDGNGVAEEKIREEMFVLDGMKSVSFNYLEDEVIIVFDTTKTTSRKVIEILRSSNGGRHKVIEQYEQSPTVPGEHPVISPPDEEIGDQVDYGDNG